MFSGPEGGSFRNTFKLVRTAEAKECITLEIVGILSLRSLLADANWWWVGSREVDKHFLSAVTVLRIFHYLFLLKSFSIIVDIQLY